MWLPLIPFCVRGPTAAAHVAVSIASLIRSWPGNGIATPDRAPVVGHLDDERVLAGVSTRTWVSPQVF